MSARLRQIRAKHVTQRQVQVWSWRVISSFLCTSNLRLLLSDLSLKVRTPASRPPAPGQSNCESNLWGHGANEAPQILVARSGQRGDHRAWKAVPPRGLPKIPGCLPGQPGPHLHRRLAPRSSPEVNPFAPPTPSPGRPGRPLSAAPLKRGPVGSGAGRAGQQAAEARRRREARGLVPGSVSRRPPPLPHARSGPGCARPPVRPGAHPPAARGPFPPRAPAGCYLRVAEGHGGPFQ